MISITAAAFVLALVALLLALSGRMTAAIVVGLLALVLYLAGVSGYLP